MKTRFTHCFIAALLAVAVSAFCRYILPPGFQFLLVEGAHFLFLILAAIWLALRFSAFARREDFLYIAIGTINTWLGVMAFGLYFFSNANANMPATMAVNLVIGLFMLVDGLFLRRKEYERAAPDQR